MAAVVSDGLIAFYTGDKVVGSTLIDEQGVYHGTVYNNITQEPGAIGSSLKSHGGGRDYIRLPKTVFEQMITAGGISCFVYKPQGSGVMIMAARASSGGGRQHINVSAAGEIVIEEYQGTQSKTAAGIVPDDQWTHVIATWSQSGRAIFAAGQPVAITNPNAKFSYGAQGDVSLLNHWYYIDNNISTAVSQADHLKLYNRKLDYIDAALLAGESAPKLIEGVVQIDGSPAINVRVMAHSMDDGSLTGDTYTDTSGHYEIALNGGGLFYVVAFPGPGRKPQVHGPIEPIDA